MGGYSRRRKGGSACFKFWPWGVRLCGGVLLLERGHSFKKIRHTGSFQRTWTKGICLHSSGGKFSLLIDIYIYSISYIFYTLYEYQFFFSLYQWKNMTNMNGQSEAMPWKVLYFNIFIYLFLPKVYADMLVLLIFYIQRTIHEHLHAGIWTELTQASRK